MEADGDDDTRSYFSPSARLCLRTDCDGCQYIIFIPFWNWYVIDRSGQNGKHDNCSNCIRRWATTLLVRLYLSLRSHQWEGSEASERPLLSALWWVEKIALFSEWEHCLLGFVQFTGVGSVAKYFASLHTSPLLSIMTLIIFITLNLDCPFSVSRQFNTNSHIHLALAMLKKRRRGKDGASPCRYQQAKKRPENTIKRT